VLFACGVLPGDAGIKELMTALPWSESVVHQEIVSDLSWVASEL